MVTKRRKFVSLKKIEAKHTPRGAWTRQQIKEWGVASPHQKGWKERLSGTDRPPRIALTRV